jgi:hypothetical protein
MFRCLVTKVGKKNVYSTRDIARKGVTSVPMCVSGLVQQQWYVTYPKRLLSSEVVSEM